MDTGPWIFGKKVCSNGVRHARRLDRATRASQLLAQRLEVECVPVHRWMIANAPAGSPRNCSRGRVLNLLKWMTDVTDERSEAQSATEQVKESISRPKRADLIAGDTAS